MEVASLHVFLQSQTRPGRRPLGRLVPVYPHIFVNLETERNTADEFAEIPASCPCRAPDNMPGHQRRTRRVTDNGR